MIKSKSKQPQKDTSSIKNINDVLDFFIKSISVSFVIGIFIGFLIINRYFSENEIQSEISTIVSSPQLLVVLALFSTLFTTAMTFTFLIAPFQISQFKTKTVEIDLKKERSFHEMFTNHNKKNRILYSWFIKAVIVYFWPLVSFVIIFSSKLSTTQYFLILPAITFVPTSYYFFKSQESKNFLSKTADMIKLYSTLMLGHLCLIYPLIAGAVPFTCW